MERRLGRAERRYAKKRAEITTRLDSQQLGVFELLEEFDGIERRFDTHSIQWGGKVHMDTKSLLGPILKGKIENLPIPGRFHHLPGYKRFNWKVYGEGARVPGERRETVFLLGVQMRFDDSSLSLTEVEGIDSFEQVEELFTGILDRNSYPIVANDRQGFHYENPAFERLKANMANLWLNNCGFPLL